MRAVKVRASVNAGGLEPGQEAIIERTKAVESLIKAGYFKLLAPRS